MPTISRRRSIAAHPETVWSLVSDPERLPAWWPAVERVEEATRDAWTMVMRSPRGKAVRADYTLEDIDPVRRLTWRHEVEESPFERILSESLTDVELEAAGDATEVELRARQRLRGWARFGVVQIRRATARQLEEALDNLEAVFPPEEG